VSSFSLFRPSFSVPLSSFIAPLSGVVYTHTHTLFDRVSQYGGEGWVMDSWIHRSVDFVTHVRKR
jgi:hypothetical protein